jgi:hypothetical protein
MLQVVVILQDGSTPVKYGLAMDMEDRCSAIPPRLARLCAVPPQNLVLVEIIQSQVGGPLLVALQTRSCISNLALFSFFFEFYPFLSGPKPILFFALCPSSNVSFLFIRFLLCFAFLSFWRCSFQLFNFISFFSRSCFFRLSLAFSCFLLLSLAFFCFRLLFPAFPCYLLIPSAFSAFSGIFLPFFYFSHVFSCSCFFQHSLSLAFSSFL